MSERGEVSEEEMRALFPYREVSVTHLESIRSKILIRCILIIVLWAVRTLIVTRFPEFHMVSHLNEKLLSGDVIGDLLKVRWAMVIFGSSIYMFSFYKNMYFRSVNVVALVLVCCLIWGDLELYLFSSMSILNYPSLAMIIFRLIPLVLLIQNYRDIRR